MILKERGPDWRSQRLPGQGVDHQKHCDPNPTRTPWQTQPTPSGEMVMGEVGALCGGTGDRDVGERRRVISAIGWYPTRRRSMRVARFARRRRRHRSRRAGKAKAPSDPDPGPSKDLSP